MRRAYLVFLAKKPVWLLVWTGFWLLLWLLMPKAAGATHLVGGQLEMVAKGTRSGTFRVTMTYYYNEDQTANQPQATSDVVIFRKSDGRQLATYTLLNVTLATRPQVAFTNPACARLRNLSISVVRFEGTIQLDPAAYADPQGYYLTQQNCCRNGGITNLVAPGSTPFLFYLEFPALRRDGRPFANSSPVFDPLSGDYICNGVPFRFSSAARDADGDELRYSLVTPLAGTFVNNAAVIRPAPYPEVIWQAGYGAPMAIPGNPALTVNARTGLLTVTTGQLGLFVFSVRVEEFRNGEKIGEVRRDFQFPVVDCPNFGPPPAQVQIENQPPGSTEGRLCAGRALTLQATVNADWNYQWRRNELNLDGATGPSLTVTEPGEYTVVTSLKATCGQSMSSALVRIFDAAVPARLTVEGTPAVCRRGAASVNLTAPRGNHYTYRWFRDGNELPGQTAPALAADEPGHYSAQLTDGAGGCTTPTDTVTVALRPDPLITLTPARPDSTLCPGDSLRLSGGGGVSYVWSRNGNPLPAATGADFFANAPGRYAVTGTDATGCVAKSEVFTLTQLVRVPIILDSLPTLCGANHPPVVLKGSPVGGIFSGVGVNGDAFDPRRAGVGTHELTYTLQSPTNRCQNGEARQRVVIGAVPTVELPVELTTYRGGSLSLRPVLTGQPQRFSWQPGAFLNATDQPNVRATNIDNELIYTLEVQNTAGCRASGSVRVRVYQRIWVPEVFTPNGDGTNDVWELKGAEEYPQAQVTVYDRWGEVVYHATAGYTQPFDGTLNGRALPGGLYAYVIRPASDQPMRRGVVLIAR